MDCGKCTLCCKLLELHEIPSPIETYCRECEPGVGCKIHDKKPEECKQYQCMWSQMKHVGIELRPDKCHILFDKISNDVICSRLEKNKKLNQLVLRQLYAFNQEGFSICIFKGDLSKYFLAKNHTEAYVRKIINDCAKLYRGSY